jgi:hypothetical protein
VPCNVLRVWRLVEIPVVVVRALWAIKDRTHKPRSGVPVSARVAIREEVADDWANAQLDETTVYNNMKIIEQRIIKAAADFLKQHEVDTSAFERQVVFYENRKILPRRTLRRGQELQAPSVITHSVNAFFTASGDPAALRQFRVHSGLIGTGEAVIANAKDDIRHYLTDYNDKVMAVEMEAGGLAQFCHDTTTQAGEPLSWVVIRGISDRADVAKDDAHHDSAAVNAAQTLRYLIPYIRPRL